MSKIEFTKSMVEKLSETHFSNHQFYFILWNEALASTDTNVLALTPDIKKMIAGKVYAAKGNDITTIEDTTLSSAFSRWIKDLKELGWVTECADDPKAICLLMGEYLKKEDVEREGEEEEATEQQTTKSESRVSSANEIHIQADTIIIHQLPEDSGKKEKKQKKDGLNEEKTGKKGKTKKKKNKKKLRNKRVKF